MCSYKPLTTASSIPQSKEVARWILNLLQSIWSKFLVSRLCPWGIEGSVPVRKSHKFRPGELAPITGVYLVHHGLRHREPHEVVIIRGESLPACRTCKLNTQFEIVKVISHVTHDWDFSGPNNLAVQPHHEPFADFRIFRRINVRLPVTFQLPSDSSPVQVHGYSSDLSAGGLGAIIRE